MTSHLAESTPLVHAKPSLGQILDKVFIWITRICAFSIAGVLLLITIQVGIEAIPAMQAFGLGFIFQQEWDPVKVRDGVTGVYGILPMIYGTLMTSFVALLLAIPIGVGSAIFLSENFLPTSMPMLVMRSSLSL